MKKACLMCTLVALLGFGGGELFAQSTAPPQAREQSPANRERAEELRERIELIYKWELIEALDLTEAEGDKLFPLLRDYEEQKRQLRQENTRLVLELKQLVDTGAPDRELKKTIKALEDNDRELQTVKEEGFHKIEKILPVKKQAQYIVFQAKFQRELQNLIQNAKQRQNKPRGP